jgi:hypothetical protein
MGSKWILERLAGGSVEWIQLAQDRDRWRTLVNTAMNGATDLERTFF